MTGRLLFAALFLLAAFAGVLAQGPTAATSNSHFLEYILFPNVDLITAANDATSKQFCGVSGHLATPFFDEDLTNDPANANYLLGGVVASSAVSYRCGQFCNENNLLYFLDDSCFVAATTCGFDSTIGQPDVTEDYCLLADGNGGATTGYCKPDAALPGYVVEYDVYPANINPGLTQYTVPGGYDIQLTNSNGNGVYTAAGFFELTDAVLTPFSSIFTLTNSIFTFAFDAQEMSTSEFIELNFDPDFSVYGLRLEKTNTGTITPLYLFQSNIEGSLPDYSFSSDFVGVIVENREERVRVWLYDVNAAQATLILTHRNINNFTELYDGAGNQLEKADCFVLFGTSNEHTIDQAPYDYPSYCQVLNPGNFSVTASNAAVTPIIITPFTILQRYTASCTTKPDFALSVRACGYDAAGLANAGTASYSFKYLNGTAVASQNGVTSGDFDPSIAFGNFAANPALFPDPSCDTSDLIFANFQTNLAVPGAGAGINYQLIEYPNIVTYYDYEDPVCFTKGEINIEINGDPVTVNQQLVDGGSTDNCTPGASLVYSYNVTQIDCSNGTPVYVEQTVQDCTGNEAKCVIKINIIDNLPPVITCNSNLTLDLDLTTVVVLDIGDYDYTLDDNCPGINVAASKYDFRCTDLGPNEVTLTATDANGNSDQCTLFVFLNDPDFVCQPEIFLWPQKLYVNESEVIPASNLTSLIARVGYELTATFYADWNNTGNFIILGQAPCEFQKYPFQFEGDDFYGEFTPDNAGWQIVTERNPSTPFGENAWSFNEQNNAVVARLTSPVVPIGGSFVFSMDYLFSARTGITVTIEALDGTGTWVQIGNPVPTNNAFQQVFRAAIDDTALESAVRIVYTVPDPATLGPDSNLFDGLFIKSVLLRNDHAICIYNFTELNQDSPPFGDGKNIPPAEDFLSTIKFAVTTPGLELPGTVNTTLVIYDLKPTITSIFTPISIDEGDFLDHINVNQPFTFTDPVMNLDQNFTIEATWFSPATYLPAPVDVILVAGQDNRFPTSPVYPDGPATYAVNFVVIDKDGLESDPTSVVVTVNNVAPIWIDGPFDVTVADGQFIPSASFGNPIFKDPALANDDYTVSIDFQDGNGFVVQSTTPAVLSSSVAFSLPDSPVINSINGENFRDAVIRVEDGDGGSADFTFRITIGSQIASFNPTFTDFSIPEGTALTPAQSGTYQLVASTNLAPYRVFVAWDGLTPTTVATGLTNGDSFSLPTSPIASDGPSSFNPIVFAIDRNNRVAVSNSFVVSVTNVSPTIGAVTPGLSINIPTGPFPQLTISLTDPANNLDAPFTIQYRFPSQDPTWITGASSNSVGSAIVADFNLVFNTPITNLAFEVRAFDADGGVSNVLAYTINVQNSAPIIIQAPSFRTFNEGDTYLGGDVVAWTDTGDFKTYTVTIKYGSANAVTIPYDASLNRAVLPQGPTFTNGPDTITAVITVTDNNGGSDTANWVITVNNVAPQITRFSPSNVVVNEGSTITNLALFFSDPSPTDGLSIKIDWFGNNNNVQTFTVSGSSFNVPASPVFPAGPATFNAKATITDSDGASSFITIPITVNNVAPTISNGFTAPSQKSTTYSIGSVPFTDPGVNDVITATINFGDGVAESSGVVTRAAGSASGSITFPAHTYCGSGTRNIVVTIRDGATSFSATYPVSGTATCAAVQCQTATCKATSGASGCTYRNVNSPVICNDGNPCTLNDRCNTSGQCLPGTLSPNCTP